MDEYVGESKGSFVKSEEESPNGPYVERVDLKDEPASVVWSIPGEPQDDTYFAVNCEWDIMPRHPVSQSLEQETYRQIINEILKERGLENPDVSLLQNYRIDLEGDGIDEVILYAENKKKDDWEKNWYTWRFSNGPGTFSIMFLRKIKDGEVENCLLGLDIHTEDDEYVISTTIRLLFPLVGFADLNGDGKMEIITSFEYYEGLGCDVFEVSDDEISIVLSNGLYI